MLKPLSLTLLLLFNSCWGYTTLFTTSTSADTAQSTNTQLQHTNSVLQADNININTQEDTNDFVGEGLGGNSGVNGEASILDRVNVVNIIKLITPSSPHSGYDPYKFEELQDVTGYKE